MHLICFQRPDTYTIDWTLRADGQVLARKLEQLGFRSVFAPGIGVGRDDFVLVWRSPFSIDGVRLRRDGSTAGFFYVPAAKPMTGSGGPAVAWDGTRYLIVFDQLEGSSDVWGAVIVPGGHFVAETFVIAASDAQEHTPAVAAIGPDRFVVAYGVGVDAIATRVVSFSDPPSRRRSAH